MKIVREIIGGVFAEWQKQADPRRRAIPPVAPVDTVVITEENPDAVPPEANYGPQGQIVRLPPERT